MGNTGNLGRLDRFFRTFTSESTVRSYRSTLRRYFDVFGYTTYPQEELAKAVEQYFDDDGRNYQHDIQDFFVAIKGEAASTIKTRLSVVRTFLGENEVEVPDRVWKSLVRRIKGSRARMEDYIPTRDELRRIIAHMPIQGQALFLSQLSSGMRIGEVLALRVEDVQMSSDPAKTPTTIHLRGTDTKSGNPRVVYVSSEATEALDEWMNKVRPNYLKHSKRTRATEETDARVFPFMRRTAYVIFNGAVTKAGLSHRHRETNRFTLHPHCLRKWFRTNMATLIPVDITEALMGHEGYLTTVYRRPKGSDLAAFYKKGEPALLLHQPINLEEVKESVDGQIQEVVNGLTTENMNLRERVQELEGTVREIQVFYKGVQELRKEEEAEAKALKDELEAKLKEA